MTVVRKRRMAVSALCTNLALQKRLQKKADSGQELLQGLLGRAGKPEQADTLQFGKKSRQEVSWYAADRSLSVIVVDTNVMAIK